MSATLCISSTPFQIKSPSISSCRFCCKQLPTVWLLWIPVTSGPLRIYQQPLLCTEYHHLPACSTHIRNKPYGKPCPQAPCNSPPLLRLRLRLALRFLSPPRPGTLITTTATTTTPATTTATTNNTTSMQVFE